MRLTRTEDSANPLILSSVTSAYVRWKIEFRFCVVRMNVCCLVGFLHVLSSKSVQEIALMILFFVTVSKLVFSNYSSIGVHSGC